MLNAPFKVDDYLVGFKYNIAKLGEAPEVVFARREFGVSDGTLTVQAGKLSMLASLATCPLHLH